MHSVTAFLPSLAFAAGGLAAPTPAHTEVRGRPNLHEVIRNPTSIDAGINAHLKPLNELFPDLLPEVDLNLGVHRRAAPTLKEEAAPVVVVDRSV